MTIQHECMGAREHVTYRIKFSLKIQFGGKFGRKYHVILPYHIQSLNSHCKQHVVRLRWWILLVDHDFMDNHCEKQTI